MKNMLQYCLTIFLILIVIIFPFSCNFIEEDSSIKTVLTKAEASLKKHPDSSLFFVSKILSDNPINAIDKNQLLKIYLLKQEAFSNIGIMDSVLSTGIKIRVLASETSDSLAIANSLLPVRGEIDFSSQQEIAPYFLGAIHTFKTNSMLYESARLSASYGSILCHKGDFVKAQYFLLDSYRVFSRLDSIRPLINVCMNIGSTYAYTKSTRKALEYYKKSYDAALKVKDSNAISSVLMNIGTYYADDINDQNKALLYYKRALPFVPSKSGAFLKMKIDYNIAVAAFDKGDLQFSERIFQSMLADCIKIKAYEGVAMASKGLGDLYTSKNEDDKALLYLNRAIFLADSLEMSYEALQMRPSLLVLYKNTNNFEAALKVSEQMKVSNDSLLSSDKQNAVHELEIKYQTEKKAIEITHLKTLSKWRQFILYGLSFFIIVLFFILRKQNKLYKEKQHSYTLLMQQYKAERLERMADHALDLDDNSRSIVESLPENLDLYARLLLYYENEKPYLNPKYKAIEVANALQVSQRDIATTLKSNGYSGFTNFNNMFRIEEVKRQFENPKCSTLKMEAIATHSGFGSRQSFYTAFEEFTGINPGYYRSEILK